MRPSPTRALLPSLLLDFLLFRLSLSFQRQPQQGPKGRGRIYAAFGNHRSRHFRCLPSSVSRAPSSVSSPPSPLFRFPSLLFRSPFPLFRSPSPIFRFPSPFFRFPSPLFRFPSPRFRIPSPSSVSRPLSSSDDDDDANGTQKAPHIDPQLVPEWSLIEACSQSGAFVETRASYAHNPSHLSTRSEPSIRASF